MRKINKMIWTLICLSLCTMMFSVSCGDDDSNKSSSDGDTDTDSDSDSDSDSDGDTDTDVDGDSDTDTDGDTDGDSDGDGDVDTWGEFDFPTDSEGMADLMEQLGIDLNDTEGLQDALDSMGLDTLMESFDTLFPEAAQEGEDCLEGNGTCQSGNCEFGNVPTSGLWSFMEDFMGGCADGLTCCIKKNGCGKLTEGSIGSIISTFGVETACQADKCPANLASIALPGFQGGCPKDGWCCTTLATGGGDTDASAK